RRQDTDLIRFHLDLGDGFDFDGDALSRIEVVLRYDVETHQLERELARLLDHRPDDATAADDDLGAAEPVDDQRLVGADLAEHRGDERQDEHDDDRQTDDDHDDACSTHGLPVLPRSARPAVWSRSTSIRTPSRAAIARLTRWTGRV